MSEISINISDILSEIWYIISYKDMESLQDKIEKQIRKKGRGHIFLPQDFLDLGTRVAVDQALSRLVKKGFCQRLSRGIYFSPEYSEFLKEDLLPSPEELVAAIVKRENRKVQVTGAVAANALGLSTQVPARRVYLTDGLSKKIKINNSTIEFRRANPKAMVEAGTTVGLVIQALRYIGKEHIDEKTIAHLKTLLSKDEKRRLFNLRQNVPYWMRNMIAAITGKKGHG